MKKYNTYLQFGIILSQLGHLFCCVLPGMVAMLSLLSGAGMIGVLPGAIAHSHEFFHHWETPLLIFSGSVLALGWGLEIASRKVDCHDTGCSHPPCEPVKRRAHIVLIIASVLFAFNLGILLLSH